MKIQNDGLGPATARTEDAGRVAESAAPAARPPHAAAVGDHFQLSADGRAVQAAIDRAVVQPDVRLDLVDRMRQLMDRGELGQDATRLAEAIIERWLTTP